MHLHHVLSKHQFENLEDSFRASDLMSIKTWLSQMCMVQQLLTSRNLSMICCLYATSRWRHQYIYEAKNLWTITFALWSIMANQKQNCCDVSNFHQVVTIVSAKFQSSVFYYLCFNAKRTQPFWENKCCRKKQNPNRHTFLMNTFKPLFSLHSQWKWLLICFNIVSGQVTFSPHYTTFVLDKTRYIHRGISSQIIPSLHVCKPIFFAPYSNVQSS